MTCTPALLVLPILTGGDFRAEVAHGAYPIRPVHLGELCSAADIIAVVVPEPIRKVESDSPWSNGRVRLQLVDVWKGDPRAGEVEAVTSLSIFCPAPGRYPTGKRVLAFLRQLEPPWLVEAIGLSWGTKVLPEAAMETYRMRVGQWFAIQSLPSMAMRQSLVTEWLVQCVEDPVTRGDAVSAFSPVEDCEGCGSPKPVDSRSLLSPAQWKRLVDVLVGSEHFEAPTSQLLWILKEVEDPRYLPYLLDQLPGIAAERIFVDDDLQLALRRHPSEKATAFFQTHWELYRYKDQEVGWFFRSELLSKDEAVAEFCALMRAELEG